MPMENTGKRTVQAQEADSVLGTQSRTFPFHILFVKHRADSHGHVMLLGRATKDRKSKQKTLAEHWMVSFLCSKMSRADRRKIKANTNPNTAKLLERKQKGNFPKDRCF